MTMSPRRDYNPWILALLAVVTFIPFLGRAHLFDWDEINFAEISREMIVLQDYLRIYVDFQPFWEKPPFFFWLQVLSMKTFGIGEFAARFPNAICGILTIVILYHIGRMIFDRRFGLLWALAYYGTFLPHLYFKTGIIDPWFNLFIFLGLYFFILYHWKRSGERFQFALSRRKSFYLVLAGLSIGFGILTKGQVALLVFALCVAVYWVLDRFRLPVSVPQFLLFIIVAAAVTLTWYGLETLRNGPWFVIEFTKYQWVLFSTPSAGHAGFPGYHFVINLIGCFPASILALPMLVGKKFDLPHTENFRKWMVILFWVVIILFSIVTSKIIHYSSLVYFPLTFLAAGTIYSVTRARFHWPRGLTWLLGVIGVLLGGVFLAIPLLGMNIDLLSERISDPFVKANFRADVRWAFWEIIFGVIFLALLTLALWHISRQQLQRGAMLLFLAVALTMTGAAYQFVPKIERYVQGAAVEFLETLQGEDCYVDVLGYKSYAQYFYTRKQPPEDHRSYSEEWLLTGDIDKPAYFVTKNDRAHRFTHYPGVEVLYEKNGFVFLKRDRER